MRKMCMKIVFAEVVGRGQLVEAPATLRRSRSIASTVVATSMGDVNPSNVG
jgi:hypothetical protein